MSAALEIVNMAGDSFFSEPRENSIVKTKIVSKYFWVWAKIITSKTPTDRIAYIDLFAGPGRYLDGTKSTPLLVLEEALKSDEYRQKLVVYLNDGESSHAKSLQGSIDALPGIETLKHKPTVQAEIVGEEVADYLEKTSLVPTFCFIDPWGYKGLSLRLVNAVVKDFACECLFFFNYNRINMGITNEAVDPHIKALFGNDRTEEMRTELRRERYSADDRETYVLEKLTAALIEMGKGKRLILPFRFRNEKGNRTSHYLIFVSKHPLGYGIMKGIMAGESSKKEEGVASFEYSIADSRFPLLFELNRPLSDLVEMLPEDFGGQSLSVQEICDKHNIGRPYVIENYQEACRRLEAAGKIGVSKPAAERQKRKGVVTFAKHLIVTFPPGS
jgi:three-Cys-motif partner protein